MTGFPSSSGRHVPPPSPIDLNEYDLPHMPNREPRGRVPTPAKISVTNIQAAGVSSPSSQSSSTPTRSPIVNGQHQQPERRPSQGYGHGHGHMRNASKAVSQSRNGGIAQSPATSPMNPGVFNAFPADMGADADYNTMLRRGLSQKQPGQSPASTLHASSQQSSTSTLVPEHESVEPSLPAAGKRLDRAQSAKHRYEHGHRRSNSRARLEHKKTVGEFSLHFLFHKFYILADNKIEQCVEEFHRSPGPVIDGVCGSGVDPDLDRLLSELAYITRRHAKPLVDTIMYWHIHRAKDVMGTNKETLSPKSATSEQPKHRPTPLQARSPMSSSKELATEDVRYVNELRCNVITYLTCRVLIEVFIQAELADLASERLQRLEAIIFEQMQGLNPGTFIDYPFKKAVWLIYTQTLGVMSSRHLANVASMFTKDLSIMQRELFANGRTAPPKELEHKVEMMIHSMAHIHIRTQPENVWRDSCTFLFKLADLLLNAHGTPLKYAYCHVFVNLLLPIASNWGSHVNTQKFREFIFIVSPRIANIVSKPRHWSDAVSFSTLILCISPTDQFASAWTSTMNSLQTKLKDRSTRPLALQAISRIVWVYLDRVKEAGTTIRRLDEIMKTVLPPSKKISFNLDLAVCEPLVELVRIIGHHYQEYCFSKIVFPLINSDIFAAGKEIKVDQLDPERTVIGIRAFLVIMADLESEMASKKPPFPLFDQGGLAVGSSTLTAFSLEGQRTGFASPGMDSRTPFSSRPIVVSKLSPSAREYHTKFCDILSKIAIICDNAFGGQAVLDEKFGGSFTPKTPLTETFTFGRRAVEDHQGPTEQRLGFYELLHVAVQALPRCLPAQVQLKPIINLLCTCTAHVQTNIAVSSIRSLKAIAKQSFAQAVTIGFARFIFNFDARYSTMSEEGLLGPDHIENTLGLYVELLQIWIEEIKHKTKEASTSSASDGVSSSRGLQLDLTTIINHVDEVDSHGVFFLCSQSRRVRASAVKVLKIVTEFDAALGRQNQRIIHILEGDTQRVMDMNDDSLTVAERSRLQKGKSQNVTQPTLVELSSSDNSYDASLWLKVFPNIIRLSFELCPAAVMLGREIICARLLQMGDTITSLDSDGRSLPPIPSHDPLTTRAPHRLQSTSPQIIIEQWKLYLIMACTTVTNAGAQTQSQLDKSQHLRKASKMTAQGQEQISSARALFAYVIPLLSAGHGSIREAIVIALSSINISLFRTLLDSLQYPVTTCKEEAKQRIGSHQRTGSNPRRNPGTDRLRTEVTQVYRLTARFLREPSVLQDEWILNNLSTYTRDLMIFLADAEIQGEWDYHKLRRQYCGLLEEVFNGINKTKDSLRYISFESRRSAFALMEDWCGYSPNQDKIGQREETMQQMVLERHPDARERTGIAAAIETEKQDLSTAALSAMATLCAGPVRFKTDRGETLSFDSRRILSWIGHIFGSHAEKLHAEKLHAIGRRALYNLIVYNRDTPYLLEVSIEQCYAPDRPHALESYIDVVTNVIYEFEDYPIPFWRILAALLFLLGNEKSKIRTQSAKLLQRLEQRRQQNSRIQDFDISIADQTTAVFKSASFEISRSLSKEHKDLAYFIFSQFSLHFRNIHPDNQRQMVYAILPWIQVIELKVEAGPQKPDHKKPTAQSYMLLANLLEITLKTSTVLHNEVQALWRALATGHPGNAQLVLNFVIDLSLDRGDQAFVRYAKQIIVYMAGDAAGPKVVEFLLQQITYKHMVHKIPAPIMMPPDNLGLPYVADLSEALPIVNQQEMFSLSQLALIYLVDLIVAPMTVQAEQVPLLLHVILVLWDNQIHLVQDQAREMLVHLIHELIITKIPDSQLEQFGSKKTAAEAFVESVRHREPGVVWQYHDKIAKVGEINTEEDKQNPKRVPPSMPNVTGQVVDIFSIVYPDIQDLIAKIALNWGTSCAVRHIACRSLQIFRCVLVSLDRPMVNDVLARISHVIVHEADDVQTFSLEMLNTVESIITALEPAEILSFPHLFWTTCACLGTVFESEFVIATGMLDKLLAKLNLNDPAVIKLLRKTKPVNWQGTFEGVAPLVYKGLKSEKSLNTSLNVLDLLVDLPDLDLIGNHTRLLFTTLGNLPRFLQCLADGVHADECRECAGRLALVAKAQDKSQIGQVLNSFSRGKYAADGTFLQHILASLQEEYFPTWELKVLIFVIGLLSNRLRWYKLQTFEVLRALIRDVDTRRSEISNCGPDLITPLLALLSTEFSSHAIAILDHVFVMSETPLSDQHIRMSMAGLGSKSIPIRKTYEKTTSLYGIPEETGWSVPMPAIYSSTTRHNMQLIYQDFVNPSGSTKEAIPTPELEFQAEAEQDPSYFARERSNTVDTQDTAVASEAEGGMSDILTKLQNLDDFFDETLDVTEEASQRYSARSAGRYRAGSDAVVDIYDQETAPILQRTLGRSPSSSSLHNQNMGERQHPTVMTPTAFTSSAPSTSAAPARPPLHSRSVTSPANNISKLSRNEVEVLSDDEAGDGTFSEDERSTGHVAANDSRLLGSSLQRRHTSSLRTAKPTLEGKEMKQRGLFRAQSRSRGHGLGSPSVPKVPEAYLKRQDTGSQF